MNETVDQAASHTSTNPENVVKIGPANFEVTCLAV